MPRVLTSDVRSNFSGSSEAQLRHIISELQLDKKIKALEHNLNSFTRVAGLGKNIPPHGSKNISSIQKY